jgi:hypothetical protein
MPLLFGRDQHDREKGTAARSFSSVPFGICPTREQAIRLWNHISRDGLSSVENNPLDALSEPIALVVDDERLILMDTSDIIQ